MNNVALMENARCLGPYVDKKDPWSSHSMIGRWLQELPCGSRVLDIGAGTGSIARLCPNSLALYGVEPDPVRAAFARPYYRSLWASSIEALDDEVLAGYDAIVLADVLEHLAEPGRVLRRICDLQSPGCRFIISVPNIANLWVRVHLLLGRFDHAERGILDATHLRFFTLSSFLAMATSTGLTVKQVVATPIPLPLMNACYLTHATRKALYTCLARVTNWLPTLLGYQFIAEVVKPA